MGNKVVHFEVMGQDAAGLQKFYSNLFGWSISTDNPMGYGIVDTGQEGAIGGGIGATQDGSPGIATFYVEADDVAAHLKRATELGGAVVMPATEVMDGVTIGLFGDPEGHVIGLVQSDGS